MGVDSSSDDICTGYSPFTAQLRFHQSSARFKVACAGVRSGKTTAFAAEFIARIMQDAASVDPADIDTSVPIFVRRPKLIYWVVAPTYRLLDEPRRNIFSFLPRWQLDAIAEGKTSGWSAQSKQLWVYPDVLIEFRTAEDPLSLVSVPVNGLWITEATRCKSDVWPNLRPRIADKRGWFLAEGSSRGRNWFYNELWRRTQDSDPLRDRDWDGFTWTMEDNPHIDRGEVAAMKSSMDPRHYAREALASFDAFEGQIFDTLSHVDNVRTFAIDPRAYKRVIAGVDFGFSSPGAVIVCGIKGDGKFDVLHEEYAPRRTLEQWRAVYGEVAQKYGVKMFYCDPSEPGLIDDMRRAVPAIKADNDIFSGLQRITSMLHTRHLTVHSSCANLVREMRDYVRREDGEDPAPNQSDHAIDALRYAILAEAQGAPLRRLL